MWSGQLRISVPVSILVGIGVLAARLLATQSTSDKQILPSFEVASIKPSSTEGHSSSGIRTGHGRLDAQNVTLQRCIMGAYNVGPHQISGAPDWLNSDRFDISAKADQPIDSDAQLMLMLQSLLADRFKLVLHREARKLPAYVLEVGKNGPKLEKAEGGESSTSTNISKGALTLNARNTDMDLLAEVLAREMDLPVVNETGLKGPFNFKLHWTRDSVTASDNADTEQLSIFTAIQEQLGLRMHSQKAPVPVLVIDHVARVPTEN